MTQVATFTTLTYGVSLILLILVSLEVGIPPNTFLNFGV